MLAASAAPSYAPLLAAALCSLTLALGGAAAAQSVESVPEAAAGAGSPGGAPDRADVLADGAPVITAPDQPGRWAPPQSSSYVPTETGGFNSFAASDTPPPLPPMEGYDFSGAAQVVVEMFTSQGCSSCPPADAMLADLSDAPDILPLSYHVDYWDYLGWADSFARPEFTARQERYAAAAGERSVYTPQIIVDGQDTTVAVGPTQLMGLIDASRVAPAMVSVHRETTSEGEAIELMPLSDLGGQVQILLVRYAPERAVEVTAGENRGKVVTYTNVVLSLEKLADWDGASPLRMTVSPGGVADGRFPEDTRHALLAQKSLGEQGMPGAILAAIRLD